MGWMQKGSNFFFIQKHLEPFRFHPQHVSSYYMNKD